MKLKINYPLSVSIISSLYIWVGSTAFGQGVIGGITNPLPKYASTQGEGLFKFLGNVLKFAGTIGGIYMIIQMILAGYAYISAAGDPKATATAWAQIWQSIVGMVIIASAFVIASVVERFTGIKILSPVIYGP